LRLWAVEGQAAYAAENAEGLWLIVSEAGLSEHLDPIDDTELIAAAVKVQRFHDRAEWEGRCDFYRARERRKAERFRAMVREAQLQRRASS
jgi:hypothetical protein